MEYLLPITFAFVIALAIAASLDAIDPHRDRNNGTFNPWTAGLVWFIAFGYAIFLFKMHT